MSLVRITVRSSLPTFASHLPQFSRSFWLLVVSGFLCSVGMFKSVRRGALFYQTLSVEAHKSKSGAI
jgi:hypothetical protein